MQSNLLEKKRHHLGSKQHFDVRILNKDHQYVAHATDVIGTEQVWNFIRSVVKQQRRFYSIRVFNRTQQITTYYGMKWPHLEP